MKTFTIPADLFDLVTSCLARAEHEKAFDGCALPGIGRHLLARLERLRTGEPALAPGRDPSTFAKGTNEGCRQ